MTAIAIITSATTIALLLLRLHSQSSNVPKGDHSCLQSLAVTTALSRMATDDDDHDDDEYDDDGDGDDDDDILV